MVLNPGYLQAFKTLIPNPLDQVNGDGVEHLLPLKVNTRNLI